MSATVIDLTTDGVVIDGAYEVPVAPNEDPHAAALAWLVRERADPAGNPITVFAREPDGKTMHLVVHPGGDITDIHDVTGTHTADTADATPPADASDSTGVTEPVTSDQPDNRPDPQQADPRKTAGQGSDDLNRATADGSPAPAPARGDAEAERSPSPAHSTEPVPGSPSPNTETTAPELAVVDADPTVARSEQTPVPTFLGQGAVTSRATRGVRGFLARLGLPIPPTEAELRILAAENAVSQHWPGPRKIAVVNPKGGANKTPTTAILAAVLARLGGGSVVAVENNQTRGTLGWRTEQGPHDASVLDLLPEVSHLLSAEAQVADLAAFVHHQTRDRYDVLRSRPSELASEQRFGLGEVDALYAALSKYYRLMVIDSGNDESDPMWLRMVDHADQLVIPTTIEKDRAEAALLMLRNLAESSNTHSTELARNAVVIVSQRSEDTTRAETDVIVNGFRPLVRDVAVVPYDQALVEGQLRYDALRPASRRAWIAGAAAAVQGLAKPPEKSLNAHISMAS